MDENKKPINKRLSEQLPTHSPDMGSWQRISSKLDALDAEAIYQEKLQQLPLHSPSQGTWNIIQGRLNRILYYKTITRVAAAVAAGLLLLFTVSRISDYNQNRTSVPQVAHHQQTNTIQAETNPTQATNTYTAEHSLNNIPTDAAQAGINPVSYTALSRKEITVLKESETTPAGAETAMNVEIPRPEENPAATIEKNIETATVSLPANEIINTDFNTQTTNLQNEQIIPSPPPPVKYYTPKEVKQGSQNKNFALAMNYLPENIYNGYDNSLFHNVDLTASYNKEKVRFNTSLGMAYNEEDLQFDMNYDIKTPVTATGPSGHLDTLGYSLATMESQYQGTEKHQYFTYNLGFGRRLFSAGKFSTWISAGAGFGVRLNDPDLISATEKNIKMQYNAQITSVNTSKPVYNDVNVNFVTGIDFNYKLLKRLSISFTPTSRWYFKPVFTKDNQPTDELTLGFKTGMKFDF